MDNWTKEINSRNLQSSKTESGELVSLNRQIAINDIEAIIKNHQRNKSSGLNVFTGKFTKRIKKEQIHILKLF